MVVNKMINWRSLCVWSVVFILILSCHGDTSMQGEGLIATCAISKVANTDVQLLNLYSPQHFKCNISL